ALEKNYFSRYDPARAKFRTFLRTCLDRYVANADKSTGRIKRGGQTIFVSLDFYAAEAQVSRLDSSTSPELLFEQEWVRSLFTQAVEDLETGLREEGKALYFRAFEMYALGDEKQTYKAVADQLGIATSDVTNYLAYARRMLRRILTDNLRRLSPSEEEYRREA